MSWEFSNDKPIFQQLVEILSREIVSGKYKPGDKIETVRELALKAGVNPNTMQRALCELENTGLIYTKRGSGRYVTEDQSKTDKVLQDIVRDKAMDFIKSMKAIGLDDEAIIKIVTALIREENTNG